jgi:hypothetical protein
VIAILARELELSLDSPAEGWVVADASEADPPTPVEIRRALQVLAEQDCSVR